MAIADLLKGAIVAQEQAPDGESRGQLDDVPATIANEDGTETPAQLSQGEYVVPADVVSMLGDGNSVAGAKVLEQMIAQIRMAKQGNAQQAPGIAEGLKKVAKG